jgi:toxin ParE1/3/4
VSESRYVVSPKADQDLEDQAYYYAIGANPEVGHRFLVAAHDTFALLATQPNMGWHARFRHADLKSLRVFRVTDFERMLVLYLPLIDGVEILRVVHASRNLQSLLRREGLVRL